MKKFLANFAKWHVAAAPTLYFHEASVPSRGGNPTRPCSPRLSGSICSRTLEPRVADFSSAQGRAGGFSPSPFPPLRMEKTQLLHYIYRARERPWWWRTHKRTTRHLLHRVKNQKNFTIEEPSKLCFLNLCWTSCKYTRKTFYELYSAFKKLDKPFKRPFLTQFYYVHCLVGNRLLVCGNWDVEEVFFFLPLLFLLLGEIAGAERWLLSTDRREREREGGRGHSNGTKIFYSTIMGVLPLLLQVLIVTNLGKIDLHCSDDDDTNGHQNMETAFAQITL